MVNEKFYRSDPLLRFLDAIKIQNDLVREMMAEFLGTAILILLGNGSVAQHVLSRGASGGNLSFHWGFGMGLAFGVYVAGNISGAHLNPAISVAFAIMGRFSWYKVPCYAFAQTFGAFIGSALVYGVYYDAIDAFDNARTVMGANATAGIFGTFPQPYLSIPNAFLDQVIGTALLVGLIIAITADNKVTDGLTPFLIGLILFSIGVAFGHNCGFALNPARDFGPRLLTAAVGYGGEVFSAPDGKYFFWVPIIAPLIGAVLGALVYKMLVGHHIPSGADGERRLQSASVRDEYSLRSVKEEASGSVEAAEE